MSRDKKRNEPNSLLGAIAVGVFAVASLGIGYLLGKEEGREEARGQQAVASSSSSSRTRARAPNPPGAGAGAGGDGFTHPRVTNLDGSPYNGRLDGAAAAGSSSAEGQPSAASPSETDEDAHLCKVCLEAPNDHVFVPCHHQACCGECAAQMRECPICRRDIRKVIRVFKA